MNIDNSSVRGTTGQLELGFESTSIMMGVEPPRHARQMASWWFQRMREAVDRAVSWTPVPAARPEQIWLPNTNRSFRVQSEPGMEIREKQLCA